MHLPAPNFRALSNGGKRCCILGCNAVCFAVSLSFASGAVSLYLLIDSEDGDELFLGNVLLCPNNCVSQPRRLYSYRSLVVLAFLFYSVLCMETVRGVAANLLCLVQRMPVMVFAYLIGNVNNNFYSSQLQHSEAMVNVSRDWHNK
jgi:hypothetical protein